MFGGLFGLCVGRVDFNRTVHRGVAIIGIFGGCALALCGGFLRGFFCGGIVYRLNPFRLFLRLLCRGDGRFPCLTAGTPGSFGAFGLLPVFCSTPTVIRTPSYKSL